MKKTVFSIALLALVTAFAGAARAQCGSPSAQRQSLLLPRWNMSGLTARAALPGSSANRLESQPADQHENSIVGLWDVMFVSGGQLYDEAFDVYHSDGTELMNDIPPPGLGNVCLGVWVKTGGRSIKLKHVFWIFDNNGSLIGRGVVQEQIALSSDANSYSGTFKFEFRDLSGNPIASMPDVAGDLTATRITPD